MSKPQSKSADAYLLEAALALRPKDVTTMEDLRTWMQDNAESIAKKASELQSEMWTKLKHPEALAAIKRIIGARVWGEVNKREISRRVAMETEAALEIRKPNEEF